MTVRAAALVCTVVLVALAAGAASFPASGQGSATSKRCYPTGTVGVARDRTGRIFRSTSNRRLFGFYGCLFRVGRLIPLGDEGTEVARPARIRGDGAVYAGRIGLGHAEPSEVAVSVQKLRANSLPASWPVAPADAEGLARITDLVATTDARFAYIVRRPAGTGTTYQVGRRAGGTVRVLETSAAIDPASLTLRDRLLRWTVGGEPRTARLP